LGGSLRSAGEGEIGEEVAWRDAEGGTHAEEVDERDVLLASLQGADLVAVKVCALAESFLTGGFEGPGLRFSVK
jgi:hypothetical protein